MGVGLVIVSLLIALMQGVFCNTWNVMMPRRIVGISGSCLTIPCQFEVPDSHEKSLLNCSDGVVWNKGSITGPAVFVARGQARTIAGKVLGDVTKKNCTTMFNDVQENYSGLYFFRLDCDTTLRFNFATEININIQPGPPAPQLRSSVQVSEGEQVRLECSTPVPCHMMPPSITWFPGDFGQEETQMQQDVIRPMRMTSTLTFIASVDHHNRSITCSISYPLPRGGSTKPSTLTSRLNVLYAPKFTVATVNTSGPVSEGRLVTFTCSSDANPPVSLYTWFRDDNGKLTKRGDGEMLILKVSQKDTGLYLCEAQNLRGSQRSSPVTLEVIATADSSNSLVTVLYIVCGVLLVLYILTVVVNVYKYRSLSRRLKEIELKGEHTYADLRINNITSDYDQLQP